MTTVISAYRPRLLEQVGIGPDNAAALLITAGDNPDRLGTEASFAALCGASLLATAIEEGRDLSSMSGILADSSYRLLPA